MLSNITFVEYITTMMVILAIYYSYIAIYFYSQEIRGLLTSKRNQNQEPFSFSQNIIKTHDNKPPEDETNLIDVPFEETSDDTFDRIEALISRVKPAITASAEKKLGKKETMNLINVIISDFPDLKISPFNPAILEMIQTECKNTGFIALSDEEVITLWDEEA